MTSPRSLQELASRVLLAGYPGSTLPRELLEALASGLAGVIFFRRNIESLAQLAHDCAAIAATRPELPPLRAIDQEGGRVARLGSPILELPPMRALGELDDPDLTYRLARCLGEQLMALGISLDFAPVLDVDSNPDNPVIGDRAFSADPAVVSRHANRFAEGLHAGGCLSCGKHFPGHGDTHLDSHLALPRVVHDRARLEQIELAPFRAAAPIVPAIMTAHVIFDALDPDSPATLSKTTVTDLLRHELGYDGVIVSDDLEMAAISDRSTIAHAAIASLRAGCDLLLVCSKLDECLSARDVIAAEAAADDDFARVLERSAARVDALRARAAAHPLPFDEALALMNNDTARKLELELERRLSR